MVIGERWGQSRGVEVLGNCYIKTVRGVFIYSFAIFFGAKTLQNNGGQETPPSTCLSY